MFDALIITNFIVRVADHSNVSVEAYALLFISSGEFLTRDVMPSTVRDLTLVATCTSPP